MIIIIITSKKPKDLPNLSPHNISKVVLCKTVVEEISFKFYFSLRERKKPQKKKKKERKKKPDYLKLNLLVMKHEK